MDPKTTMIMIMTGIMERRPMSLRRQLAPGSLGAIDGNRIAAPIIIIIIMAASMKPGMNPARYSRPMDSSTSTPYTISPMLGGINMPRVPPAARDPITSLSL